ncbi:MAG: oxidoreductase [Alphaproteobacteria bacterium]|nr:oxidoreductase [Alphaproteobacteria bacterium]
MPNGFKALLLTEADGKVHAAIEELDDRALPPGDVTVRVSHSTLNYKDGLILNGLGRLVRTYPHVPGVDFVGEVERSDSPAWRPGDRVIVTGWRVGELHWGGYAGKARVKSDWLVPLPRGLTPERAMAIGTAGFTSMLAIMALEEHGLSPAGGEVVVTGAAGGLGGIAVAVLAKLGYKVAAVTGRAAEADYLGTLGAASVLDRAELADGPKKPMLGERWAGAVDAVGGKVLAAVVAQLRQRASVAVCGNAGGIEVPTTVLPFILRGVNMLGIDSVLCPVPRRMAAWERLARDLPMDLLDSMTTRASLEDLPTLGKRILEGGVRGRVVIEL